MHMFICVCVHSHYLCLAQVGSEQLIASPLRVDDRGAPGFAARALVDEEHGREAATVYKAGLWQMGLPHLHLFS